MQGRKYELNLGKQIKQYRTNIALSQEELAEKIYVSRQTISNWENDKNYPDINSLLMISEVFGISLDNLIKGDIERMKKEIDKQEYKAFQRNNIIFTIFLIAMLVLPIPLISFLGWIGLIIVALVVVIGMFYALQVEKYKKKYDIQTYKEIVSFTEGKMLDEIQKAKEEGKRPYQKILLFATSALLAIIMAFIMMFFTKKF